MFLCILFLSFFGFYEISPLNAGGKPLNSPPNSKVGSASVKSLKVDLKKYIKNNTLSYPPSNLFYLPKDIKNFKNLTNIDLHHNHLAFLPKEIGELKNLESLSLIYNRIMFLPDTLGNLTNLKRLRLGFNELQHVPSSLKNLQNLVMLGLRNNHFQDIPKEVFHLKNLETLILDYNNITEIPKDIASLQKLKYLSLSNNPLEHLSKSVFTLTNLETLFLQGVGHRFHMSKDIKNLKNLKHLRFQDDHIRHIPDEIKALKNLGYLAIEGQQLKDIDFTTFEGAHKNPLLLDFGGSPLQTIALNPKSSYRIAPIKFDGSAFENISDFLRCEDLLKKNVVNTQISIQFLKTEQSSFLTLLGITSDSRIIIDKKRKTIRVEKCDDPKGVQTITEMLEVILDNVQAQK